ncbi:MAG: hypothetical protein B7Z61_01205 [Acidobacteria bacterium 37-71-11]|nr:MAG: hypothetical protein B7Z61_01205 [Acidobacteria bacterium 37-71-11]
MRATRKSVARFGFLPLLLLAPAVWAGSPQPAKGCAIVEEHPFSVAPSAFAVVEPVAAITVPALVDGSLVQWRALPGMAVRRGEVLGRLAGPERAKEMIETRSALEEARSAFDLARKNEAAARETYPVITNVQKLNEAQAAVAQAESALKAAKARWAFVRSEGEIRAPVTGALTGVYAADGQAVAAGTVLARIEDSSRLWLHAVFYGRDALLLTPGLHGLFAPLGGGKAVPVRVGSVIAPMQPDGGRAVGCLPVSPAAWFSGQSGTLKLEAPPLSWPAVPESALILKGESWYVLVRGQAGDERRKVEPGPEAGGWRAILRGVKPGEQVVVKDAYLLFHRDVAKAFTPPD